MCELSASSLTDMAPLLTSSRVRTTVLALDDLSGAEDEAGLLQSTEEIKKMIKAENDGTAKDLNGQKIGSDRIVVGGFSQGGAISLLAGLTNPSAVAGVAALSTWLPLRAKIAAIRAPTSTGLKVFQAHGDADPVVRYEYGQRTHTFLKSELGLKEQDVQFNTYPRMPHSACPEEVSCSIFVLIEESTDARFHHADPRLGYILGKGHSCLK